MVRIYPLLCNGCVFYGPASKLYKLYRTESNQNENENENGASPRQSRKKGSAKD
jgi:hypothetical protein